VSTQGIGYWAGLLLWGERNRMGGYIPGA